MAKQLSLLILLAAAPVFGQQPQFSTRVRLTVSGGSLISNPLRSCLAKKLREIPGVVISEEGRPNFEVHVAALSLVNMAGNDIGVALSFVAYGVPRVALGEPIPNPLSARTPIDHVILSGADVSGVCALAVSDIDQEVIEPAREAWQARQDLTPDAFMRSQR